MIPKPCGTSTADRVLVSCIVNNWDGRTNRMNFDELKHIIPRRRMRNPHINCGHCNLSDVLCQTTTKWTVPGHCFRAPSSISDIRISNGAFSKRDLYRWRCIHHIPRSVWSPNSREREPRMWDGKWQMLLEADSFVWLTDRVGGAKAALSW